MSYKKNYVIVLLHSEEEWLAFKRHFHKNEMFVLHVRHPSCENLTPCHTWGLPSVIRTKAGVTYCGWMKTKANSSCELLACVTANNLTALCKTWSWIDDGLFL